MTEPSSSSVDLDSIRRKHRDGDYIATDNWTVVQEDVGFLLTEVERLQADLVEMTRSYDEVAANLEYTRQIVAAQASAVEAARTLMRTARSAALHPGPFVAPFNEFVGLDHALACLDAADVPAASTGEDKE